jgi:CorA-like Mg2+ transporter protein
MTASNLPRGWELPRILHDRLGKRAGRQRTMFHYEHLLVILHEVPEPGAARRKGLFFWRNPDGQWRSNGAGSGLGALVGLLDRYEQAVAALEQRLSSADAATDYFEVLRQGAPLRRAAENMKRALQSAREAVDSDKHIIVLRDRALDIDRSCELLVSDAKSALDFAVAQQSEQQSRTSHALAKSAQRLNVIMAMFLPLTAAAGVFGMKLESGLDVSSPVWFWAVIGVALLLGLLCARSGAAKVGAESQPRSTDNQEHATPHRTLERSGQTPLREAA